MKDLKILGIIGTLILIVALSGCTSNDSTNSNETVVNGQYNTINQTVDSDTVWNNDTCPKCGEPDAEAQAQTDKLISNKCTKCGYKFYSINKY